MVVHNPLEPLPSDPLDHFVGIFTMGHPPEHFVVFVVNCLVDCSSEMLLGNSLHLVLVGLGSVFEGLLGLRVP